jgi:hypothetical protein
MTMAEHEETLPSLDFRDKKVRLVVLGILQIIFGAFCFLMVPLMVLGMIASAVAGKDTGAAVSYKMMIPGILFYLLLAVWFIWMGIGSVKALRWARALILISSWLWLICGVCGFVFVLVMIPNMYDQMSLQDDIPAEMVVVMQYMMIAFMAVIYVIIPGIFVLFYKGKHVKATCEYRDPKIRWTDKCPLPVLGVSFVCAIWAVSMLSMGASSWTLHSLELF